MNTNLTVPYDGVLTQPIHQSSNLLSSAARARTFPGLRLSIDCPVERVRAYYHPEGNEEFNPGVAVMGHLLANIFCDLMHDHAESIQLEVSVPWDGGGIPSHTHIDLAAYSARKEIDGVYEIKTTSDKSLRARPETIRQIHRQQGAINRAGKEHESFHLLGKDWFNIVIGKAGNASGWVSDRIHVEFDADAHQYSDIDYQYTSELVRLKRQGLIDLLDDDEVRSYCLCGKCIARIPVEIVDSELAESIRELARLRLEKKNVEGRISKANSIVQDANLLPNSYELDDGLRFSVSNKNIITFSNNK